MHTHATPSAFELGAAIAGFEVRVSESLIGAKEAIGLDGLIVVSPAMYDLLRHADQRELEHLARSIRVRWFPAATMPLTFSRDIRP